MLNRMAVAVLALIGVLIATYMSAYKFGLLGSIVCGTGGCETVQNSPWSVFMGIPVPVIGLAGYGLLLVTSILGLQPRFEDDRRVSIVLIASATIGLAFSMYLSWLEAAVIHAWCRWCIVSAILATLIFVSTLPEFRRIRSQP